VMTMLLSRLYMLLETVSFEKLWKNQECAQFCSKWQMKEYSGYINKSRNIARKHSRYSSKRFEHALICQQLVPKLLTPEHKHKWPLPSMWWFLSIHHIAWTYNCLTFLVSMTKKCSERTMICERLGSHWKSDLSTDRDIKKWFPGLFKKALWMLTNVRHCPRERLLRKCCMHRCKFT
jgi:hypothetical protein